LAICNASLTNKIYRVVAYVDLPLKTWINAAAAAIRRRIMQSRLTAQFATVR